MARRSYARDWRGRFAGSGGGRSRGASSTRRKSGSGRSVKVSQLKNGRKTKISRKRMVATGLQTRGTIGVFTGNRAPRMLRPGSPVRGNKNMRYVSRTHTVLTGGGKLLGGLQAVSPAGRAHSAIVNRRSGGKPKSGYIVEYGN